MGKKNGYSLMTGRLSKIKQYLSLVALAAGILFFPFLTTNPYYLNVANIIGLNTMVVVGLNLLIGYAGQISLGHAAFYGLGAYLSGILTVTYNMSPWPAMLIALLATGLIALIIGIPTLKLHGHYLVMATLGFNLIINIILIQWDKVTGGPSGFPGIPNLQLGSWALDSDLKMYFLIWSCAFIFVLLSLNLVNSRVGRGLRALHGSEIAAASVGVPTEKYKVKVFVLSALFASLAGSLYAHYLTFISPKTFDIFFSVELVTMVIVGGMGSVWGALFGTIFLTSLPNVLHFFDEYKDVFYGLILVLILIFVPEGLVVAARKRWLSMKGPAEALPSEQKEDSKYREHYPAAAGRDADPRTDRVVSGSYSSGRAILNMEGVTIRFGGIVALAQVSFDVVEGSITSLIGPNGAGKTTMINVVSGNYQAQSGTVIFDGQGVKGSRPYQMAALGMTRTFQNVQIFENMTVLENVMVGLHARTRSEFLQCLLRLPGFRKEGAAIEQQAWDTLSFLGLDEKAHWPASSLSFGEQKRVEMARGLVSNPRLILLDEPVAGLNMTETAEIARLIKKIRSMGISVLLVEHDMGLVMGVSDKVVVLNYGRKIAEGHPEEIQKNEKVLSAYLGSVGLP
ncbi:MAG: branched-chain amino acid ABC transporter ATP-binding protein/permease [Desulfomonile tiedjei]|nr:branched-chain amino acid ABC transporter ATP-binding protein/permease [Desulfomonile tiedjei]